MSDQELFDALGFTWDRKEVLVPCAVRTSDQVVARYRQVLATYVWDAGVLENNPLTFVEVKTLLDGVTVGGRKIADQEQILNLAESSKRLMSMVREGRFALDKPTFTELHDLVARDEALEWGHFRGEGDEKRATPTVGLGEYGDHKPMDTTADGAALTRVFERGVAALKTQVPDPFERGAAFFLFGALQQFFFDGNKRTSRHMMNGVLMSAGLDAISIPAAKAQAFNAKMVDFYRAQNGSEMMEFLEGLLP